MVLLAVENVYERVALLFALVRGRIVQAQAAYLHIGISTAEYSNLLPLLLVVVISSSGAAEDHAHRVSEKIEGSLSQTLGVSRLLMLLRLIISGWGSIATAKHRRSHGCGSRLIPAFLRLTKNYWRKKDAKTLRNNVVYGDRLRGVVLL